MKIKYFLILFLMSSFPILNGEYNSETNQEQTTQKPCKCYCSEICEPREVNYESSIFKRADKPYYSEKYDRCFCQPWDESHYTTNHCDEKDKTATNLDEITCCPKKASK